MFFSARGSRTRGGCRGTESLFDSPRHSGNSNACPRIKGPLHALWEESALIKMKKKVRQRERERQRERKKITPKISAGFLYTESPRVPIIINQIRTCRWAERRVFQLFEQRGIGGRHTHTHTRRSAPLTMTDSISYLCKGLWESRSRKFVGNLAVCRKHFSC